MAHFRKPKKIGPADVSPEVFHYDELYDKMKEEESRRLEDETKSSQNQKPKYVDKIKEIAELRKSEKELRKFKRYTRDRNDALRSSNPDEVFYTSAYKAKLNEMEKLEREKQAALEAEKDNVMNFTKLKPPNKSTESRTETSKETQRPAQLPDELKSFGHTSTSDSINQDTKRGDSPKQIKKPRLITPHERRQYLRKVLAKRTIRQVFDDAVERYHRRKSTPIKQ